MKYVITTLVAGGLIVLLGTSAAAQHEGHQMPGTATDLCRDQAQQAIAVIDAASRRLELARQSNSAAEMRAAVDSLQGALIETKAKLNVCLASQSSVASTAAASASLDITFKTRTSPATVGDNELEVTVNRPDAQAVSDADVSVLFVMPAMPQMKMGEMRHEATLKSAGGGKYTGSGQVMMAGNWNVTVIVKQGGKEIGQKKFTLAAR